MFVGRTAELALLRAEMRAACEGSAGRVVVVEGPEGIGKTALVHHALARDTGVRVLAASGEEGERQLSLGVLRQLIDGAVALPAPRPGPDTDVVVAGPRPKPDVDGDAAVGASRPDLDAVVRAAQPVPDVDIVVSGPRPVPDVDMVVPRLRPELGEAVPASRARLEGASRALTVAGEDWCAAGQVVCDVIDALQARGPLVVLVDDAQWADGASLRALGYVLRRLRSGRVLALVTCRDLADPWLPEGLRRLLTGDETLRITLSGLDAADLVELAAHLPGHAADLVELAAHLPRHAADLAELATRPPRHACDRAPGGPDAPPVATSGAGGTVDAVFGAMSGARGTVDTVFGARLGTRDKDEAAFDVLPGAAGARGLTEPAAVRLRDHTLGNPLHACALLNTVPVPVLADRGVRLPAPATYVRPFAPRLSACTPAAGRLVAACAVLGARCPLHVAAAVAGGLDDPLDALEEAVNAGLLRELPGRLVAFPEPLARAAAYDGLGAGVRARLHLAASRVVDDIGTALRHRAAAAGGPDEALAEELAGFAAKAAQHGQWQEAAAHLELAAGLTESAARRDELRTAALEHILIGGDVLRAAELAAAPNADPRPARRYVLGRLALASGRFEEAAELLAEAWRHREPGFAADVAEQLGWLHLVTGDRAGAASWAYLAIQQPIQGLVARPYDVLALGGAPIAGTPPGPGTEPGFGAPPASGRPSGCGAEPGSGTPSGSAMEPGSDAPLGSGTRPGSGAELESGMPLASGTAPGVRAEPGGGLSGGPGRCPAASLAAAVRLLGQGAPDQACAVLRRVVSGAAQAGLPHHRLLASGLLAAAEYETARWDNAAARAEEALAEAVALGQRWLLPCLEVACVAPLAARGEHERALAHATAARATARRLRHVMGEHQADLALALLGAEPGSGRTGDVAGWEQGQGWVGDVFVPDPRPGRIEALVADGRLEEAERALAAYGGSGPGRLEEAERALAAHGESGRGWCEEAERGLVAYGGSGRGWREEVEWLRLGGLLLAARNLPARAEESFIRALALVEGAWPLEEARVLLDLGRLLRRTGRRRAAAERLGAARAIFDRLGARPLLDRCAHELEACGLEPPATIRLGLTPQELSTATLVAGGLTNRQIARELLISVKTVEYHIGKIYTKLGIGSRVALAAKLAAYGQAG
ncbi:AAA family ATPase [Nonomuraea sp. NPDC050786]|uniref:helix-turn-helix transcriptional regulator n=1 Tax=Nonomuraea sp. NPDC050786 TaxID=3154840 RepID=UPI0033D5FA9C